MLSLKIFFPTMPLNILYHTTTTINPKPTSPQTDTFIEKDASINTEIERLRLAATDALLNREDVIIVASVSCIYGLGSPEDYKKMVLLVKQGEAIDREQILEKLIEIQYERNDYEPAPGRFRVRGDTLDIFPSYAKEYAIRIEFFGPEIDAIKRIDPSPETLLKSYLTSWSHRLDTLSCLKTKLMRPLNPSTKKKLSRSPTSKKRTA